ncbi:MAG: GNAT family N-acetyltransferase [Syntrophales bacterium]
MGFADSVKKEIQYFGIANVMKDAALRGINTVVYFKILRCITNNKINPDYLNPADGYTCRFLNADELLFFSGIKKLALPTSLVRANLKKGDQCYGILDGDFLASYSWFSNLPTTLGNGLQVKYDPRYIYVYHGYTHPAYRGRRLGVIRSTRALYEFLQRGFKGFVAYVEENNLRNLHAVYRTGYRDFGRIYIVNFFGKYLVHHSPGCAEYGFTITPE